MFDPFGDFETAGYLRNELGLKDGAGIKEQQHLAFTANVAEAATFLAKCETIAFADFCEVHRLLFGDFYPWAGRDRHGLDVARLVSKGGVITFAASEESRRAVDYGLRLGNDPEQIAKRPGEVMGLFAWGHPFLDGNGRTMVVVHSELMARAGLMIDWTASAKDAYLAALTQELEDPTAGALDKYFRPLVRPLGPATGWLEAVINIAGLAGQDDDLEANVAYAPHDPEAEQQYEDFKKARNYTVPGS